MIGNDIVDLKAASRESNWKRRGFIEKLFTIEEKEIIFKSSNPERSVWLLWSMKEAAYKANQRKYKLQRSYNPTKYTCAVISSNPTSASGQVRYGGYEYYTQTRISTKYIYTTASFSAEDEIYSEIIPSFENLKLKFIAHYSRMNNLCKSQLTLFKDRHFVPHLYFKNQILESSFSFSQHGKFSAYTMALMNY